MTPNDVRAELEKRKLTQSMLAALTLANARTVRRWVDVRRPEPLPPGAAARIENGLRFYDAQHGARP